MEKQLTLYRRAKERLMDEINPNKKILEIGPLNHPLFRKNEANIYYADIKGTDDVKDRYSSLNDNENIVEIDYIIEDTYENKFGERNVKFDYVFSSHVLEHVPNPISFLLDISTILSENGKVCLLLPNKEFTFDHYRENSSFSDLFDMYVRGEEINTPRLLLDSKLMAVNENAPHIFWNNQIDKYPEPNVALSLKTYHEFIEDFDNQNFDGHYWVFTDNSFLKILENLFKLNLIPYVLYSFYPTAFNDNTFGLILELDESIKKDFELRSKQINKIRQISDVINKKRFEIDAKELIQENNRLKETIVELKKILDNI